MKLSFDLIKDNAKSVIPFVIIFSIFQTTLFNLLIKFIFFITLKINGLECLSLYTFNKWIMSPFTIIFLLITIIIYLFLSSVSLTAMIRVFANGKKISCFSMIIYGIKTSLKLIKPKNILLLLFILIVVPMTGTLVVSGLSFGLFVPSFIMSFIKTKWYLLLVIGIFYLILFIISIRWAFLIHYYILKEESLEASFLDSRNIIKNNIFSVLVGKIVIVVGLYIILKLLSLFICFLIIIISKLLVSNTLGYSISLYGVYYVSKMFDSLFNVFVFPVTFAYLSVIFKKNNSKLYAGNVVVKGFNIKLFKVIGTIFIIIMFIINTVIWFIDSTTNLSYLTKTDHTPIITAHRGSSINYPENSLIAFRAAIRDGADYIELDVHETKDGVLVISHDANLKRLTGISKNISDVTYDEIKDIDFGINKWSSYSGLSITTLEDVLKTFKGKVRFNIEIKSINSKSSIEKVISLINKYDVKEDSSIASMNANALILVKEIDSSIKTIYIMYIAQGDIASLSFADAYSIEESYVTDNIISTVHNNDKEILVWTVNNPKEVKKFTIMGVDNIVTDDPIIAVDAINRDYLKNKYKFLNYIFKKNSKI